MIFLATINSFSLPVISFLIVKLQFTYYSAKTNPDWEEDSRFYLICMYCWVLVLVAVGAAEKITFAVMGEKLTLKLRMSLIDEIMHKQVSWFDREDRAPGIITTVLSADIASLNGMTSEVLVTIFELAAVTTLGLIGGIYFCW